MLAVRGTLNFLTAPLLHKALKKHVQKKGHALIVDLSGVEFIDSSGLATLIEAQLKSQDRQGRLVLFGIKPQIAEVFSVMHVTDLFTITTTEQEALSVAEQPPEEQTAPGQ